MTDITTCSPKEFFKASIKLQESINILLNKEDIKKLFETKAETNDAKSVGEQFLKNITNAIMLSFEKYEDETLNLLSACFLTDKEELEKNSGLSLVNEFLKLLGNKDLQSFFGMAVKYQ